jgi:hypothetical protein
MYSWRRKKPSWKRNEGSNEENVGLLEERYSLGEEKVRSRWRQSLKRNVGFEALSAVIMKSSVFWDITPYSPLKANRRFGGTCRLQLQGQGISQARNQRESRLRPWRWKRHILPKHRLTFHGLHCVISQTIELPIKIKFSWKGRKMKGY